jgi:hypothetical protein
MFYAATFTDRAAKEREEAKAAFDRLLDEGSE